MSSRANIELEIQSKYSDEGFKKADQAVRTFSRSAKTATDSVQKVTNALGTLDGKAGKIAGSIGNIFSSFAHGGVMGLAIAGITTAFSLVSEKIKEVQENAKKAAESVYQSFANSIQGLSRLFDEMKSNTQSFYVKIDSDISKGVSIGGNEASIRQNELKGQNVNETNIVEKAKRQNEINRIARETELKKAEAEIKKAQYKIDENNILLTENDWEIKTLDKQYKERSKEIISPINKQINDAEQSYANTRYTNMGVKSLIDSLLIDSLKEKRTRLENILEGRDKPHGRDAKESDYTDPLELNAFKMHKQYREEWNNLDNKRNGYIAKEKLLENQKTIAESNLDKIKSDNQLGQKQDQKALEDAVQKSYEERAKVEEEAWKQAEKDLKDQEEYYRKAAEERDKVEQEAWKQAEKDLKDQEEYYRKAAEERDKFEAEAEKQVEQQKRKEDAEKKQADVEKKHADKIKELDKRIEDAKERQAKAQEIQDFFANGGRVSDWYKDENHGDESKNKADRNKEKGINALKAKLSHYKDKNGKWLRNFSPSDMDDANTLERDIAKLEADYNKDYDSEMKAIEAEKKRLEKENHDNLKAIADALRNGGVVL